jgi:hypothetical protein
MVTAADCLSDESHYVYLPKTAVIRAMDQSGTPQVAFGEIWCENTNSY